MKRVSALLSKDWRDRRAAIELLRDADAQTVTETLLFLVRENNENLASLGGAVQLLSKTGRPILPHLIALLDDPSADVRSATALLLGECADASAVPALRKTLDDADDNVRYHAIEALGKLRAVEAADDLMRVLDAGDFFLSFPAVDALARMGDPTVARDLLRHLSDPMLVGPVASALGEIGDAAVVEPLAQALGGWQTDVEATISAIGRLHQRLSGDASSLCAHFLRGLDPNGRRRLIETAERVAMENRRDGALAAACARLLGWMTHGADPAERLAIRDRLEALLHHSSAHTTAAESLASMGGLAVPVFLQALQASDEQVRRLAVDWLARIGDANAVPPLLEALESSDTNLSVRIAAALGRLGGAPALDGVLANFGHPSPLVRQALVESLLALRRSDVLDRLLALVTHEDARVRESACLSLGAFDEERVLTALFVAADDPGERVRQAAMQSLARYLRRDPRVRGAMAHALAVGTPGERAVAARFLAHGHPPEVVPLLIGALDDSDVWTRIQAGRSLVALLGVESLPHLRHLARDVAAPARAAAAEALGTLGLPESVATLEELVHDKEPDVVYAAIWALASAQQEEARRLLIEMADRPNAHLRQAALAALRSYRGREVLQTVQRAATDPETRSVALQTLSTSPDAAATRYLLDLLREATLRPQAVRALAARGSEVAEDVARALVDETSPDVRRALIEVLGHLPGDAAVDGLLRCLEDPDSRLRRSAVLALHDRTDARVGQQLSRVASQDPDEGVRSAARRVLSA